MPDPVSLMLLVCLRAVLRIKASYDHTHNPTVHAFFHVPHPSQALTRSVVRLNSYFERMNTNLSPDAAVDRLRRCREEERADECKRNLMGRFSEAVEFSVRDIRFIQRKILLGSLETSTRA